MHETVTIKFIMSSIKYCASINKIYIIRNSCVQQQQIKKKK